MNNIKLIATALAALKATSCSPTKSNEVQTDTVRTIVVADTLATTQHEAMERVGFVRIGDVVPDAILEIRYYTTYNFVGSRIDGYQRPEAWLTRQAADSLRAVSDELKSMGYRLKIFDAYRPQRAVDHFVRWSHNTDTAMKAYFYPDLQKSELFEQDYVATRSGHSRGSTVDLTLLDMASGREVDMGGTFDHLGPESHPDYRSGLTNEQYANRQLLRTVMLRHGFRPLYSEWWHFTLRNEPYPDTYFDIPII